MSLPSRPLIIVGVGGLFAYFLLKSRVTTAPTSSLGRVASTLGIHPSTLQPRPTGTGIATGGGTYVAPRTPTSGLGFGSQPSQGSSSGFGSKLGETIALTGATAGIAALVHKIFGGGGSTTPQTARTGGTSGGGVTGGPGGVNAGGSSGGANRAAQVPWADPTANGFYDASGNWVPTDEAGNILPDPNTGLAPGYYASDGSYQPYLTGQEFVGPSVDTGTPVVDETGTPTLDAGGLTVDQASASTVDTSGVVDTGFPSEPVPVDTGAGLDAALVDTSIDPTLVDGGGGGAITGTDINFE